jgi:hypothetical protein
MEHHCKEAGIRDFGVDIPTGRVSRSPRELRYMICAKALVVGLERMCKSVLVAPVSQRTVWVSFIATKRGDG